MQTRQKRELQLTEIGFISCGYGYSYPSDNIYVGAYKIGQATDIDWNNLIENIRDQVSKLKPKLNFTTITDLDKMQLFEKSLGFITGPEITDPNLMFVLEKTLSLIHDARKQMFMEVLNYKNSTASVLVNGF